jgi:hypothetical protein
MKLAILTQYYPPEVGAPQARLSELAQQFVEEGHEVTVLTAMPNYPRGKLYPGYGGIYKDEWHGKVRIIRTWIFPTKSVRFGLRMLNYLSFVFTSLVFGLIRLPRVDFLLTESPPLFLGLYLEPGEGSALDFQCFGFMAGERRAHGFGERRVVVADRLGVGAILLSARMAGEWTEPGHSDGHSAALSGGEGAFVVERCEYGGVSAGFIF